MINNVDNKRGASKQVICFVGVLAVLLLAGCGQKGDLYFPNGAKASASASKVAITGSVFVGATAGKTGH